MRKLVRVMEAEMRTTLRRRSFLFFAFGLPLILGAVALGVMLLRRGDDATAVAPPPSPKAGPVHGQGFVDQSGLIQTLPDEITPERLRPYADETAAQAALTAGELDGYFVIPADYVTSGGLRYVTADYNPMRDSVDTNTMEWVLLLNLLGDPALATEIQQPFVVQTTSLQAAPETAPEASWVGSLLPTIMVLLIYMVVLMPAGLLVNAITDEKKNRVLEVLLTSISARQFMGGKFLALLLMGLLQTLTWIGVLWLVLRFGGRPLSIPAEFTVPTNLFLWALLYGLLGYVMYSIPLAGLGALAPDMKDVRGASLIIMLPLIVGYFCALIALDVPNSPLAIAVSLFPLTASVGMIARMAVTAVPVWQAVMSAILQLVTAVLILLAGTRLFRASLLLSGQPFSAARYARALRGQA